VHKKLVDALENDDQLAFVLAHELGHIVTRHHIKKLQAALGANLLILASTQSDSPGFSRGLSFALASIFTEYSKEDEFTADELAVKYTRLAGFDSEAGISVMEILYKEQKKQAPRSFSYFRTHPHVAARIRHIKEMLGVPLAPEDYLNTP